MSTDNQASDSCEDARNTDDGKTASRENGDCKTVYIRPKASRRALQINGPVYGDIHLHLEHLDCSSSPKRSKDQVIRDIKEAVFHRNSKVDLDESLDTIPDPAPGTASWLMESPEYHNWIRDKQTSLLWVHGRAGTGKSVLVKTVMRKLQAETEVALQDVYLCNRHRTTLSFTTRLLAQVLRTRPQLIQYLEKDFRQLEEAGGLFDELNRDVLWKNFEDILTMARADMRAFLLVIDGLDACSSEASQSWIMKSITSLLNKTKSAGPRFKFLITSRPMDTIARHMATIEGHQDIDLDSPTSRRHIDNDLSSIISYQIDRIDRIDSILGHAYLKDRLKEGLVAKANGSFLWSKLCMREMEQNMATQGLITHNQNVEEILHVLPTDLDDLYHRILVRITPLERDTVWKIWAWVSHATRPFTVEELKAALNLSGLGSKPHQGFLDVTPPQSSCTTLQRTGSVMREASEEWLQELSGGLLRVNKSTSRISFVHHTAEEYLRRIDGKTQPELAEFVMDSPSVHRMMAERLYRAICIEPEAAIATPSGDDLALLPLDVIPLAQYASHNLIHHVQEAPPDVADMFDEEDVFCRPDSKIREQFMRQAADEFRYLSHPDDFSMLHFASYFGLTSVLKKWLDVEKEQLKSNNHPKETSPSVASPLHWACRKGHLDCAKLLVDYDVDLYAKSWELSCLTWAVRCNQIAIVQYLVSIGYSLEILDRGLTPLGWAAWDGRREIALTLMKAGAIVDPAVSLDLRSLFTQPWNAIPWYQSVLSRKDSELMLMKEGTMIEVYAFRNYTIAALCALLAYSASLSSEYVSYGIQCLTTERCGTSYPYRSVISPLLFILGSIMGKQSSTLDEEEFLRTGTFLLTITVSRIIHTLLYMGMANSICLMVLRPVYPGPRRLFLGFSALAIALAISMLVPNPTGSRVLASTASFNMISLVLGCSRAALWQTAVVFLLLAGSIVADSLSELRFNLFSATLALFSFILNLRKHSVPRMSPLNLAILQGHTELVKLLVENGARFSEGVLDTLEAIQLAAKPGQHITTLCVLLHHLGVGKPRLDDEPTILQLAVMGSQMALVMQLVDDNKSDVNELSPRGFSALHTAAFAGDTPIARFLLSRGANPQQLSQDGISPHFAAVCGGHCGIVELLGRIDGEAWRRATIDGVTPLHVALLRTDESMVKLLIQKGASPNCQDMQGLTPKDYAIQASGFATGSSAFASDGSPAADRKTTMVRNTRNLIEETRKSRLKGRRFDRLGFYLLRTGVTSEATEAYSLASGPRHGLPWWFCQGCGDAALTKTVWICSSCPITTCQPVLCDSCYSKRARGDPILNMCNGQHRFFKLDVQGQTGNNWERGYENGQARLSRENLEEWLDRLLHSPALDLI